MKTELKLIPQCVVAGMDKNDEDQPSGYLAFKRNLRGRRQEAALQRENGLRLKVRSLRTFDPTVHVKDRPNTWAGGRLSPINWPRYLAVDFGYTAPFVCLQWWARDPDRGALDIPRI